MSTLSRSRAGRVAGALLLLGMGAGEAAVPAAERQALIDLYNATGGAAWTDRAGWLGAPGSECGWFGVTCNGDQSAVIGLALAGNNLDGTISETISSLTELRHLFLDQNRLRGRIPQNFGQLNKLEDLGLASNALAGEIPVSFGSLPLTGQSGLRLLFNGLYTEEAALLVVLNLRQPGWFTTQTIAPANLAVTGRTSTSVTLAWTPIVYSEDDGFYRVRISEDPGGPYATAGITADKSAASLTVTDLVPGTRYYFLVDTTTVPHANNANAVVSEPTAEVSATTTAELPTAAVSGGGSICPGGTAQLSVALTGTPPWTVTWSDGATQSGLVSSPAARSVTPGVTTTYTVTAVTNVAGTNTGTGSAVVTVNPPPATPIIVTPSAIAPGQTGIAGVEAHAGSTYAWAALNASFTTPPTGPIVTFVAGAAGTVTLSVVETSAAGCPSASGVKFIAIGDSCPAPAAPVLSSPAPAYLAGQSAVLTWTDVGLDAAGVYELETSRDGFASVSRRTLTGTTALVTSEVSGTDSTLSARVRAVQGCGTAGPFSGVLTLAFRATPATFLVTRHAPSWTARPGDAPPAATLSFRNVGGQPGRLNLAASAGFFGLSPATLDVAPGAGGSVTVTARASALQREGVSTGLVSASFGGGILWTPIALTVASPSEARATARVTAVVFQAPAGETPAARELRLIVTSESPEPVYLSPEIGPGGAWLSVSGLEAPVTPSPEGTEVVLALGVDRSRRSFADGPTPLRTVLKLTPFGGNPETDAAVVEVVDVESFAVEPGAGSRLSARRSPLAAPPGGTSLIVPTAVKAVSGLTGQTFTSDAWLRNVSGAPVSATLFFTPDGKDGLVDPGVLETTVPVPAGQTLRLADLLGSVFRLEATSGQVEVRSPLPQALSLRTTVDSILAGGGPASRFGTELPVVTYGSGVGVGGGELAVPGIDDDASNRANLILAETTGAAVFALVTLHGPDGRVLGSREYGVPPHGKVQENRIVEKLSPGRSLSGGWLGVTAVSGAGRVVALATVIDNASGSFSAILGSGGTGQAGETFLVPSVARTVGLNDTLFKTRLDLVNRAQTAAVLTLSYVYTDQDDGNRQKRRDATLTLPARGALAKETGSDVLASLFGVTGRSFGSILVTGATAGLAGVAGVSTQVDPFDPSKGFKTAQVNGVFLGAAEVLAPGQEERRVPNAERSSGKRTNVVLVWAAGEPCLVELRARTAAGQTAGSRVYDVGPATPYRQINQGELFGDDGLRLGEGPFQNVELAARVSSGDCRVVALATVIDNLSRNPEIFLFGK